VVMIMLVGFTTTVPLPIATKVVSFNPAHGEVYLIQHYVIKSVICDRSVVFSGFDLCQCLK